MTKILHVSSAIQEMQGTSLQTQEELGIAKAKELGFAYKLWNEGGQPSRFEDLHNRPVLRKLLLEIEDGKVHHLFVFNTDRLSRNQKT
nr:recombinase family protein [Sneathiella aquimaris]